MPGPEQGAGGRVQGVTVASAEHIDLPKAYPVPGSIMGGTVAEGEVTLSSAHVQAMSSGLGSHGPR